MARSKYIIYRGVKFRRYPDSNEASSRNYYKRCTADGEIQALHRELWKDNFGPIPEGFVVHHIDENPLNNRLDNLECITEFEHKSHHASNLSEERKVKQRELLERIRPLSKAWIKTPEGIAWRIENGKTSWDNRETLIFVCEYCGEEFERKTVRGTSRFCSGACRTNAWNATGVDDERRICEYCGTEYVCNKYSKGKCCSRKCSTRNYYKHKRSDGI